jgi:hypothetical protein
VFSDSNRELPAASAAALPPSRAKRSAENTDPEVSLSDDDAEAAAEVGIIEGQRQAADAAAAHARQRTQHRYSAHATEYKEATAALLHVHERYREKCDAKSVECYITAKARGNHNRYYVAVVHAGNVYKITDTVGSDVLSPLGFIPESLAPVAQHYSQHRTLPVHRLLTYMAFSQLVGNRSRACQCGKKKNLPIAPCDRRYCVCLQAGVRCNSACHSSKPCANKHD